MGIDLFSSKFGHTFQIKILTALITDKIFYHRINEILDCKYFDSEANQTICNIIIEYYKKYEIAPTKDVFRTAIPEIKNQVLRESSTKHIREVFDCVGVEDIEYVKDETISFCRNQELRKALDESLVLLNVGEFDQIRDRIDKASRAGLETFTYYDYAAEIDNRYNEPDR